MGWKEHELLSFSEEFVAAVTKEVNKRNRAQNRAMQAHRGTV